MLLFTQKQQPTTDKMQLKAILNHVEKQKGFVYHAIRWNNDRRTGLLVSLRPHGRSRPVCSGCDRKGPGYDTLAERRFEFVPLWAIPVFFLYAMRRVDCPRCGVTVEKVPWADGKHQSTFSFRLFLASWAKRTQLEGNRDDLRHQLGHRLSLGRLGRPLGTGAP